MTDVARALRKRLASKLQLQLGHAGVTVSATVADDLARQTLKSSGVEALAGYVGAVEAGAPTTEFRDRIAADPIMRDVLVMVP